jgi:hypothetical protein
MGQSVVFMVKGIALGKRDTTLTHHHTFSRKIIPVTEKRLDEECMSRLKPRMKKVGGTLMSDGWQSTTNQTITFLEGVTDKSTGLPIFKEISWFTYKVSGVMCSASACDHCWSIEGWIHSKRRKPPSEIS